MTAAPEASRPDRKERLTAIRQRKTPWDLVVIGGGVTGAGIARIAAARGLKTLLVEQQDYAWGTSSRSSKMVHGGLRYLGSGQYRLTRDAVRERERMLQEAPGLVDPLHYIMPHYHRQFPGPRLFGMLLWFYDRIAGRRNHEFFAADRVLDWIPGLQRRGLQGGTRFADAGTDDARLVLRLIAEARAAGAETLNYVRAEGVKPGSPTTITLKDTEATDDSDSHEPFTIESRLVVNATGAWTDELRRQLGHERSIRPLRGSHLVVPFWRLPVACSVSLFHPDDKRPVFIFPWQGTTVIGTTDLDHKGSLADEPAITTQEVDYLLNLADAFFPDHQVTRNSVIASWSGVRPVVSGDQSLAPSKESREHAIWNDQGVISIAGGKLTTFRLIAEEVLVAGADYLPDHYSARPISPTFRPPPTDCTRPPGLSSTQWRRLQGCYGPDLPDLLRAGSLTPIANTDLFWAELIRAAKQEDVIHLDDLLLRRTRLGLLLSEGGRQWLDVIEQHIRPTLGWNQSRWQQEADRYLSIWRQAYYLPTKKQDARPEKNADGTS